MKPRGAKWVWLDRVHDRTCAGALTSNAGYVAHVLVVRYANRNAEAWPSQRELMASTNLSKSTVHRALHELERIGLLGIRTGHPAGPQGHVYSLLLGVTETPTKVSQRHLVGVTQTPNGATRNSVGAKAS
jgi:pyocin large subunit-like protein